MKGIALFLALYLFVGSLFPRTDFGQLAKVGNILEHYQQHRSELESEQLSFSAFLKMHFILLDDHQQAPGHEHKELPFHSANHSQIFSVYPPSSLLIVDLLTPFFHHQFFYTHAILSGFVSTIFHPPSIG